jgi:small subunit ribosomal protein S8
LFGVVGSAGVTAAICGILICAEFVLESSRAKARFQELENLVGNYMMTDPIADMLTRIRNGLQARHESIMVPYSKLKFRLAQILAEEKYIESVHETEQSGKKSLQLTFKYQENGAPAINTITRISKPGLRVYKKRQELPTVLSGYGVALISTPLGIMTNNEARKQGLGGEVLCEVS